MIFILESELKELKQNIMATRLKMKLLNLR
nr:MAG TPA: hypothetical protein [Crassvirales sp.]